METGTGEGRETSTPLWGPSSRRCDTSLRKTSLPHIQILLFFLLFRQNYSSLILRKKKGDYVYDFMKSRDKKQNENKLHVWKSLFFCCLFRQNKTKTKQKEFPWLLTFAREEVCFRQVSEVKPKSVTSVTRSCGCVSLSRPPLRLSHRVSLDNLRVSSATPERISGDTDDGKNGCSSKLKHPHIC